MRFDKNGKVFTTRLLQVSGKRGARTIRLYKGALVILDLLHPGALESYLAAFQNHVFPGDLIHIARNHRVSEAIAMCQMTGMEFRPYSLSKLQKEKICRLTPDSPSFYIARDLKKLDRAELNKTIYTRIVGAVFYPGGCYALYNTQNAVMKWNGSGEMKTVALLTELARKNSGAFEVDSAILFGKNQDVAFQTLIKSEKNREYNRTDDMCFYRIYRHIHFVPLNSDGIRLLRLMTLPNWKEKMLDALFESSSRPKTTGSIDHDAFIDDRYYISHLDGDIARLIRIRDTLDAYEVPFTVLCYPWQGEFVRGYLGERVRLGFIEMEALESVMLSAEEVKA